MPISKVSGNAEAPEASADENDDVIVKPASTDLHDSQVRAYARTRAMDLPTRGRLSKQREGEIKAAFADEWTAATGVFEKRIKRLQNEWDKATAHLVPYTVDASAGSAPTQEVAAEPAK
jgi:hypothetical protein